MLVLMLAAVAAGAVLEKSRTGAIHVLESLCALMAYIGDSIEAFGTPLCEITAEYHSALLDEYSFGEVLRRDGLAAAVGEHSLPLAHTAERVLEEYAGCAGHSYRAGELAACRMCHKRLSECLAEERREFERTRRLYRYLPPLAAALLILLLL